MSIFQLRSIAALPSMFKFVAVPPWNLVVTQPWLSTSRGYTTLWVMHTHFVQSHNWQSLPEYILSLLHFVPCCGLPSRSFQFNLVQFNLVQFSLVWSSSIVSPSKCCGHTATLAIFGFRFEQWVRENICYPRTYLPPLQFTHPFLPFARHLFIPNI